MMKRMLIFTIVFAEAFTMSCSQPEYRTLSLTQLRDKIAGGWAGKMIGVSYGAPTEFKARGETYEKELLWEPNMVEDALTQDDLYVQMSFMMTMDKYGIDAPAEKFAKSFATAGYRLWHANVQARKNFWDGIMPPASGSPEYNLHADDIDFQIESDYIGFMCPGMPVTANRIADKIGHIMNYGDGVYGGMFVAGLHLHAFFETDVQRIIELTLQSIPVESEYAQCVRHVIELHQKYPQDWRVAWRELEDRWGEVDMCGAFEPFNIDAKLNGAYIAMGLLYGQGDFAKTMEVAIRCGQDSDCNPSNAAGVIGVMKGYEAIPDHWKSGIQAIADSQFIFTNYSFNSVVERTLEHAKHLIQENGGKVTASDVSIKLQQPKPPTLEVSFPKTSPTDASNVFDDAAWTWKGRWHELSRKRHGSQELIPVAKYAEDRGAEAIFTFTGTGVVLKGDWQRDGGQADVYIDGLLHRPIDTYYWCAGEGKRRSFLWHVLNLAPGRHTVRLVVTGKKKAESQGTRIYLTGATVFGPKEELKKLSN